MYACLNRGVTVASVLPPTHRGLAAAQRSFTQPPRAFTLRQRDPKGRAKRGAEAPGQRTARGRLLRRVSRRLTKRLAKIRSNDEIFLAKKATIARTVGIEHMGVGQWFAMILPRRINEV